MDAFSYLSVLLSIIIGLAITQVLQGYRGLLLARARVRLYAPTLIWSALLLVIATQSWWASFGLAGHTEWTFAGFTLLLLQTVLLYMMSALVLPDIPVDSAIDLRAHYYRERRPFYALLVVCSRPASPRTGRSTAICRTQRTSPSTWFSQCSACSAFSSQIAAITRSRRR